MSRREHNVSFCVLASGHYAYVTKCTLQYLHLVPTERIFFIFKRGGGEGRGRNYLCGHIQVRFRHAHHETKDWLPNIGSREMGVGGGGGERVFKDAYNTFDRSLYDYSTSKEKDPLHGWVLLLLLFIFIFYLQTICYIRYFTERFVVIVVVGTRNN